MWDFAVNTADRFVASTPAKLWFGAFCVGFVLERLLKNAESGQKLRGYGRNVAHSIVYLVVFFLLARQYIFRLPRSATDWAAG
jgi:hypothetical protein